MGVGACGSFTGGGGGGSLSLSDGGGGSSLSLSDGGDGGGSGGPWSLTDPPGLVFYTDPEVDAFQDTVGGTPCAAGSPQNNIAVLRNQVGGNDLPKVPNLISPIWTPNSINGRAAFKGDGANSAFYNDSWMPSGWAGATLFVVAKLNTTTGFQPIFGWQYWANGGGSLLTYANAGIFGFQVHGAADASYTDYPSVTSADLAWHILALRYDSVAGFVTAWIDRVQSIHAAGPTSVMMTPLSGLGYGFWPSNSFSDLSGNVAAIYDKALSDADVATVHDMLHGLTGL